jgi:hypothetical protein
MLSECVADTGVPVFSKPLRGEVGLIYVGGISEKLGVHVLGVVLNEFVERFSAPVVLLLTHGHTPGFECN